MLDRFGAGPLLVNKGHPLNRGRISWWLALPGINYGGARWYDLIGSYHGTLTNMAAGASSGWSGTTGPGGYGSILFDGVDDYVAGPAPNLAGSHTLAVWVLQPVTTTGPNVVIDAQSAFGSETNQYGFYLIYGVPKVYYGTDQPATAAIPVGIWSHVAQTYDFATTTLSWYINAAPAGQAVASKPVATTTLLQVGARGTSNPTACALNDLSLYNRALSAAEVRELFTVSRRGYPGVLTRFGDGRWNVALAPTGPTNLAFNRARFNRIKFNGRRNVVLAPATGRFRRIGLDGGMSVLTGGF